MTGALYFINDPPDLPFSSNVIKYVHLYPYSGHVYSGHTFKVHTHTRGFFVCGMMGRFVDG